MDIKEVKEILRNYRLGRCSLREREIIDQWFDSIHYHHERLSEEDLLVLREKMRHVINRKIDGHQAEDYRKAPTLKKFDYFNVGRFQKFAAVFVIGLFALGVGMFQTDKFENVKNSIDDRILGVSKIHLSDGSVVWLKNDSELDYPDQFAGEQREVYLSGEAFFDVVKDP
ncbi:MAG: FecR domain-containing protein, partial [Candidatus Paceibacterota bacterium]